MLTNEEPKEVDWIRVGDRTKIADKLDELGFDAIIEIDAGGNMLTSSIKTPEKDKVTN